MRRAAWLVVVACSAPPRVHEPAPPPLARHTAVASEDAATQTEASPTDAAAPVAWHFDWQAEYDRYEAFLRTRPGSGGPCDFRVPHGEHEECFDPNPKLAAKGRWASGVQAAGNREPFQLDRGLKDRVTRAWSAALLDDSGHLASKFGPVTRVGDHFCIVELEMERTKAAWTRGHFVLMQHPVEDTP